MGHILSVIFAYAVVIGMWWVFLSLAFLLVRWIVRQARR